AGGAELVLVDLFEEGALVELDRLLHVPGQVALGDVEHPDLQLGAGLRVHDQVVQAAPGALHLLERGVVQDGGQLLRQGRVEGLDAGLDGLRDVLAVGHRALEGLVGQGADEVLGPRTLGLLGRRDHLVEEAGRRGLGGRGRRLGGFELTCTHYLSSLVVAAGAAGALRSTDSFFRSSAFWSTRSRSPSSSSDRSTLVSRSRSLSRVASSFRRGSTCWTIRAGSKSSIELNCSWTAISLPSPVRVFSTRK